MLEQAHPVIADQAPVDAPQSAEPPSRLRAAGADLNQIAKDPDLAAPARLEVDRLGASDSGATPSAGGLHLVGGAERFASQGVQVHMEVLRPDNDEKRPAILILHGASGIGDGTFYRGAAEIFAERGYITFIPHYLEGALAAVKAPASKPGAKTAKGKLAPAGGAISAGFDKQERVLLDALESISNNPYVDTTRIGVFGLSLGGFHALNLSSRDYRIGAVVDMSGALRGNNPPDSDRIAPTLALHGAKDKLIPVSRAKSLADYLKNRGIPHDLVVYPDQGHFFRGKSQTDALQRSAAFFGQYLTTPGQDPSPTRTVRSQQAK